ncbi:trypsin-like peptidase domain-containing protein [Parasalinivibrio latis]|uniref:trypsin-like peptidase domain-containing protein n=1 Tax=Parasalinivibrio latis TaxID=2952610 RepID=UPI0030E45346
MKSNLSKLSFTLLAISLLGCQTVGTDTDRLYNQYRAKINNKAFAIGTNNVAGAAWGAATKSEAMNLAKQTCVNSGGYNCVVTEVNGFAVTNNEQASSLKVQDTTVNNFNIVYQGVSYTPNLSIHASGIFIDKNHILTTSTMADMCSKVSFERLGRLHETNVVRTDKTNNLAVLKAKNTNDTFASIGLNGKTIQGERTYTYGFDLADVVNDKTPTYQGKITDGIISSASGQNNDVRVMRITNELNKGNVGGPVISDNGNVIGMVSSGNKTAIKSSMFTIFLNELGIQYSISHKTKSISPATIADSSKGFTVPLVCLNES